MRSLLEFLAYPFVWRALVAGVLVALCASLIGVTLVLRRLSFMGDGLSHVAFGAMALAGALGLAGGGMTLALPLTAACAVVLLRGGAKGRGDASLAMLSVGAMALGYLLMNAFPSSANVTGDVCTTLFGAVSLLTLSNLDAWLCVGLSALVVVWRLFTYHRTFDIAFDEEFARASGTNTAVFNLISAVEAAVVIVVSMRLVGALLVSALIVFPAMTAMRLVKSFRRVMCLAALLGVAFSLAGILAAVVLRTPVGATIVVVNVLAFVATRFRRLWCAALFAALFAAGFCLWAHRTVDAPAAPPSRARSVVASIPPLYDWTRHVLGAHTNDLRLVLLQRSGGDLHSYQPSAGDIRVLADCDLFVCVGGVSDAWALDALAAAGDANILKLLPLLPPRDGACSHDQHDGHAHACGAADEHIWLSLQDATRSVFAIAEALAAHDALHAADYRANAMAYIAALRALDAQYTVFFTDVADKTLVFADRFPFARLAADYRLKTLAAFHGCSAEAEASFETVARLARAVDEEHVDALFVLEDGDRRLAEAVRAASETKSARIFSVDSLQSPRAQPDYLGTMRANLATFREALGGATPTPPCSTRPT